MTQMLENAKVQNKALKDKIKRIDDAIEKSKKAMVRTKGNHSKDPKRGIFKRTLHYLTFQQYFYNEGNSKDLYIEVGEKAIELDEEEWGGLKSIKLVKFGFGSQLWTYKIMLQWTRPGKDVLFRFTDEYGDVYKLWCARSGKHFMRYNSSLPNIVSIRW